MISRLKSPLFLVVSGLLIAGSVQQASAQGTTLQTFYAIGLAHAEAHPYNFTGRVFEFNDDVTAIASGTLLRRHTVLTAGHVVYDATYGFATNLSFSRGLYENYFLSEQQVTGLDVLSGYQTDVDNSISAAGGETIEAATRDLGLMLITDPPVDSDWGVYDPDPTQLTNGDGRFILGYPGETFDGRTMAYIVPPIPYVQIGLGDSGAFQNDQYLSEGGFSGGPVYAVVNGKQMVVAELTSGNDDTTGEFNVELVRAIDTEAATFFQDAEYTAGLISAVKITGPTTVKRGISHIYHLSVQFATPNVNGTPGTTNRYSELMLNSDTPGTTTAPLTTIKKISNTQFRVTFSPTLRPGSTVNLSSSFDTNMASPNSALAVLLK